MEDLYPVVCRALSFVDCLVFSFCRWINDGDKQIERVWLFFFELQLLRGICGLRAMLLRQPLLMTCTSILTTQQLQSSSPEYQSLPFPACSLKSDTHLHLHPPVHLSFKQHKPCRLLWTFCRLNSFKISFNYRPSETGETFFFFFLNWQLQLLLLVLFWGQSLMNNICPWRW